MIMLFDKDFRPVKTVRNDEELFWYIKQEILKSQETKTEDKSKPPWQFNQYSHQLLDTLLKEIDDKAFLLMAKQACYWQSSLICIYRGDRGSSSFFVEMPEFALELDVLKSDWCDEYLKAHNLYTVRG